jgi:hypothetical protein
MDYRAKVEPGQGVVGNVCREEEIGADQRGKRARA